MKHHAEKHEWAELGTVKGYLLGFVVSALLTWLAYFLVAKHISTGTMLILLTIGLAFAQMIVQFIYFLHLGSESRPRWNLIVFLFMLLVLVVIVGGSLWIMYHLNYQMMPSEQMETHMRTHEGI